MRSNRLKARRGGLSGQLAWQVGSAIAPLAGLASAGILLWALGNRMDAWEVSSFVLLVYGSAASAVLGSFCAWRAHKTWGEGEAETQTVTTEGGELTSTLDERPAGAGFDLETELEPLWDFARLLRWILWCAVLVMAAWFWLPQASTLVGWWQRQVTVFRFR